jgi:hypothetical protein
MAEEVAEGRNLTLMNCCICFLSMRDWSSRCSAAVKLYGNVVSLRAWKILVREYIPVHDDCEVCEVGVLKRGIQPG